MTIAIGILSQNAVVIAADSQEGSGYAGDFKQSVGKINWRSNGYPDNDGNMGSDSICITGAGDSCYLPVVKQKILEAFLSMGRKPNLGEFGLTLEGIIQSFYHDHIIPFSQTSMDLRVQFIIAAQSGNVHQMWVTSLSAVRTVDLFTTVGSGERWASSVIPNRVYMADEKRAAIAAAYAVYVAKTHAEGCGGDTSVVSMRPRWGMEIAKRKSIEDLEQCFRRYEYLQEASFGAVASLPKFANAEFVTCETIGNDLAGLRDRIAGIELFNPMPSNRQTAADQP